MSRIKILLFFVFLLVTGAFFLGAKTSKASELERAYFRIKAPTGLSLIKPYLHHDFGENVFSIEAPSRVVEILSKNPMFEFRGNASLWKIDSHWTTSASCSPLSSLPWGVSKVKGGVGGSGIKVAVVDSGIYTSHPDLKANIVDCVDAQTSSLRKRCEDGNGHGTHIAGTIAANGKIKGVAPDAKLMAIKVCSNSGWCWSDDVARGIRYAADKGANVINISLGGSSLAQDERNAIDYAVGKGVLLVAASGNSGPGVNTINYPAAYYKTVAVGATDTNDLVASFSSRGNNYFTTPWVVEERDIEFAAPGVNIQSTWKDGCYKNLSGTSMATPHVTGLSAVLWQGSAGSTRIYLQNRAISYGDLGESEDDPLVGFGLPTVP